MDKNEYLQETSDYCMEHSAEFSEKEEFELKNSGEFKDFFIMVADAGRNTDNMENPEEGKTEYYRGGTDYLACGLDPEKSTIFSHSQWCLSLQG